MTRQQRRIVELTREAPHMTADDVAKTLRVRRTQVYWAARRYGLKCKPMQKRFTDKIRARALRLAKDGLSDAAIAARLGFAVSTVREARWKAGVRMKAGPKGPPTTAAIRLEIARRHLIHGESYREIGRRLRVTKGVIAGAVYRARHNNWDLSASVEKEVEAV